MVIAGLVSPSARRHHGVQAPSGSAARPIYHYAAGTPIIRTLAFVVGVGATPVIAATLLAIAHKSAYGPTSKITIQVERTPICPNHALGNPKALFPSIGLRLDGDTPKSPALVPRNGKSRAIYPPLCLSRRKRCLFSNAILVISSINGSAPLMAS